MKGDSLIECPVSNSWSFLVSVPNMATGVGYQDDAIVNNNEEENGGRVSTVCLIMSFSYISVVICISPCIYLMTRYPIHGAYLPCLIRQLALVIKMVWS